MLDITGKDKAKILVALFNRSEPVGLGIFHPHAQTPLTEDEARELLKNQTYFDYVGGRVLKVNLAGDTLDPYLYDRDNGAGAAARAISNILNIQLYIREGTMQKDSKCQKRGCKGHYEFLHYCGVGVCTECDDHKGLARCFCGWSASGGDGRRELEEMGETIEPEDY